MGATTTNDLTTNEQTKLMWFLLVVALGVGLYSVHCLRAVPQVREQAAQVPSLTCDQLIRLPLRGRIESLNVSAAAAALLYEILQRRGGQG